MVIGKIRSAVAAAAVCFAATSASAAVLSTNDFEAAYYDFSTDGGEIGSLVSLVGYESTPSSPVPAPFSGFGSKYMALDTDDAMVWHTFTTQSADVYFDSYVKMSPCAGDFEYASDAKFVVFLNADTNLCVISGTAVDDRTPVTNVLTTANIEADSWHRLTVRATAGSVYSFSIYLDGTQRGETFYSLVAGTTMSNVGLKGTGAIDDLVVRTTAPVLSGSVVATIDGEDFATVEDALAASNGKTVTLSSDHSGTAAVTKSGTYVVDKGSYTFGGVVGTNCAIVSSSSSGNVITYTVKAPVAVWDGNVASYDFSTLTRTTDGVTYTMAINPDNATINSANDYITIGSENQKWTVKITADADRAFGSTEDSGFTVIAKVANAGTSESSNRAILNYYTSDTQAGAALSQYPNGCMFPTIYNWAYKDNGGSPSTGTRRSDEWVLKSDGSIQTLAMSYGTNPQGGTAFYVDGTKVYEEAAMTASAFKTPEGLTLGGVPIDSSTLLFAMKGMKIYSVAAFKTRLAAEDVAAFNFPSEVAVSSNMTVSEINAKSGATDLCLKVANGVTITGDTTFSAATTVRFVCDGSFTLKPPAGNTATFDFSAVTGQAVVLYEGALPSVSGSVFTSTTIPTWVTDAEKWTGTVWLRNITGLTEFEVNPYGNESSVVRLTGIQGWLKAPGNYAYTNAVPVELINTGSTLGNNYALELINGNSANSTAQKRCTLFKKLIGSGSLAGTDSATTVVVVIQDASEFTGDIYLNNKIVVFGDGIPDFSRLASGKAFVMQGKTITIRSVYAWKAPGGIEVDGELRANGLNMFESDTSITTTDNGVFTFINSNNTQDHEVDYSRITGTGTLRYADVSNKWRSLSTVNFPTGMILENNLSAGLICTSYNGTNTIGSLSGSGQIRSDYYGSGSTGDRDLRILQAKDTTYSGLFADSNDRIRDVIVAPGASSAGTLTLSGAQTAENGLTVEYGAKVKLTGTWKGDVTVAGELSGNGTIIGDLTLSEGAALGTTELTVNGATTIGGNVDVYLPAGTTGEVTLLSSTGTLTSTATFTVYVGGEQSTRMKVKKVDNALKVVPASAGAIINIF